MFPNFRFRLWLWLSGKLVGRYLTWYSIHSTPCNCGCGGLTIRGVLFAEDAHEVRRVLKGHMWDGVREQFEEDEARLEGKQ